jgi:hypothetical protein
MIDIVVSKWLRSFGWTTPVLALLFTLLACATTLGCDRIKPETGVDITMKTYPMGRFSIDVPITMKQAIQDQRIRSCDVTEFVWPTGKNKDQVRDEVFQSRLAEINKLKRPEKVKKNYHGRSYYPQYKSMGTRCLLLWRSHSR